MSPFELHIVPETIHCSSHDCGLSCQSESRW